MSSQNLRRCLNCGKLVETITENHCSPYCLLHLVAELSMNGQLPQFVKHDVIFLAEKTWHQIRRVERKQPFAQPDHHLEIHATCGVTEWSLYKYPAMERLKHGVTTCLKCVVEPSKT